MGCDQGEKRRLGHPGGASHLREFRLHGRGARAYVDPEATRQADPRHRRDEVPPVRHLR